MRVFQRFCDLAAVPKIATELHAFTTYYRHLMPKCRSRYTKCPNYGRKVVSLWNRGKKGKGHGKKGRKGPQTGYKGGAQYGEADYQGLHGHPWRDNHPPYEGQWHDAHPEWGAEGAGKNYYDKTKDEAGYYDENGHWIDTRGNLGEGDWLHAGDAERKRQEDAYRKQLL